MLDDVLDSPIDPLWDEIGRALTNEASLSLVVSCCDLPRSESIRTLSPLVLNEHELAFDAQEVQTLTELALDNTPHVDVVTITSRMRGCPSLVHHFLRKVANRTRQRSWAAPEPAPELSLLPLVAAKLPSDNEGDSQIHHFGFVQWLQLARGFRSFTVDLLAPISAANATSGAATDATTDATVGEQEEWFTRARALPLFSADSDDETGADALTWTAQAWAALDTETTHALRVSELRTAAERILSTGRNALALFPLLQLRDLDNAEILVGRNFRHFLMFTDGNAVELLASLKLDPERTPALALLHSELESRTEGYSRRSSEIASIARAAIDAQATQSWEDEFRRATLSVFASVSAGERSRAERTLNHILELVASSPVASIPIATAHMPDRTRLVGRLYLAYWSALQLDRHADALVLATHMAEFSETSDRLYALEQVSLTTEQDLAGIRSLSRSPDTDEVPSQAVSLRHLEVAEDRSAFEVLRPLIERHGPVQSRSAIDALVLIVRCQASPDGLRAADVDEVVSRSRALWRDDRASSFIAWAGIVAYSTIAAQSRVPALASPLTGSDVLSLLGRAAAALVESDFHTVIEAGEPHDAETLPRLATILHMYRASAHLRLGNPESAVHELVEAWRDAHSAPLIRFSLRFIPEQTANELTNLASNESRAFPAGFVDALLSAQGDPRPVHWHSPPMLTPTEREILALMQRGLKNTDIAAERFVTLGTLRSQIRTLYRKLDVADRAEALSIAHRLRLLPEPVQELRT